MKNLHPCVNLSLGAGAVLLSPIAILFLVPLSVGAGLDVFETAGETPVTLMLCTPIVLATMYCFTLPASLSRAVASVRAWLHHVHPAHHLR